VWPSVVFPQVVAGLLHDVVEDTDWSPEQLCARFGARVSAIVAGVTDAQDDGATPKAVRDAANQQRLLLAVGGSLQVALVKLADRVHNMRTLDAMPPEKRAKKAKETMELFVPLAATIGVGPLEAELRQLSAKHLSPLSAAGPLAALTAAAAKGAAAEAAEQSRRRRFPNPFAHLKRSADETFARATCPALLAEFLVADAALREAGVARQLQQHQRAWAEHCAAVTHAATTSAAARKAAGGKAEKASAPGSKPGWLSGAPAETAARLRATYAAALVAGFANAPAAFGVDAQHTVTALATILAYQ
jgi:GTP pyrophosphokinase